MKKKFKLVLALIPVIIVFGSLSTTASAERLGTGKIIGGAKNILFWRDSSIYEYRHSIDQGFDMWNGHLSSVSVSRTNTKSNSRCDVYWGDFFPPGSTDYARTDLKLNNQTTTNYNVDWYWCEILFNSNLYNYTGIPSFDERKGTACHEYGHFLGLAHPPAVILGAIMQKADTRSTQVPTTYDFNWLSIIYG